MKYFVAFALGTAAAWLPHALFGGTWWSTLLSYLVAFTVTEHVCDTWRGWINREAKPRRAVKLLTLR